VEGEGGEGFHIAKYADLPCMFPPNRGGELERIGLRRRTTFFLHRLYVGVSGIFELSPPAHLHPGRGLLKLGKCNQVIQRHGQRRLSRLPSRGLNHSSCLISSCLTRASSCNNGLISTPSPTNSLCNEVWRNGTMVHERG
jgi:hypothetical protein